MGNCGFDETLTGIERQKLDSDIYGAAKNFFAVWRVVL